MNKKIKVLIAAVVVLFLGLGIYTFASPNDEEDLLTPQTEQKAKKVDDKDIDVTPQEETEEETEEEDNEQVINVPGRNNNQGQNNPGQNNDEQNLPQGDTEAVETKEEEAKEVDTSKPEVKGIKNNEFTKGDVTINVTDDSKVTITLNGKEVENGTKIEKDDTYNLLVVDENGNETKIIFTIDKTSPKIEGVEKEIINKKTTLTITEANLDLVKVNNEEVTLDDNKLKITEDGKYKIEVLDKAGNSEILEFELDTEAPTFNVTDKNSYRLDVTVIATDKNLKSVTVNGNPYDGELLQTEGTYELFAIDTAGNSNKITITIDKTKPKINILDSSVGTENIYSKIDLKFTDNDKVSKVEVNGEEVTITNGKLLFAKDLYLEGDNTVKVTDKAGNTKELTFEVDTTAPKFAAKDGKIYNCDIKVNISDKNLDTVKVNNELYKNTTIKTDGTYKFVATDKAGNLTQVTVIVDKTKPVINVLDSSVGTNNIYSKIDLEILDATSGIDTVKVNDETVKLKDGKLLFTKDLYLEGENTVVVTDKAKNSESITFVYDKTLPTIAIQSSSVGTDNIYSKINFTASDENGIPKITINGTTITRQVRTTNTFKYDDYKDYYVEGNNTIVVYDVAGNTKELTFELDTTAPTIEATPGKIYKSNIKVNVTDKNLDTVTKNGELYKGETIVDNGTYKFVATDKAGNTSTVTVGIDKTKPVITVLDTSIGSGSIYSKINLEITDNDVIKEVTVNSKKVTLAEGKLLFAKDLYTEGNNTVKVTDRAGNIETLAFIFDSTPAKITKALVYAAANGKKTTDAGYAKEGNIHVRFAVDSDLAENPIVKVGDEEVTATLVSDKYYDASFSISNLTEGKFGFTIKNIKDVAGNETAESSQVTNGSWVVIDKTNPTIKGIEEGKYTKENVTLTITDTNLDKVTVNNEEVTLDENNKITLSNEKTYTVVATDKAGNTTTKTFTIDKTFAGVAIANLQTSNKVADKIYYAKEKDRIFISVQFKEAINDNKVAFKLVQGQKELVLTDLTKKEEVSGVTYSKYYNAEKGVFDDGEINLLVTGIEDLAGNTANNITATTNSRRVFLDMTAPTVTDVKLTKNARYDKRTNIDLTFSEKIIKFNDEELNDNKITIANKANGTYEYTFTDISGNVGTYELTVAYKNLDPVFTVNTAGDLVTIKDQINDGSTRFLNSTIKLNEDIDLSKNLWNPIFAAKATMDNVTIDGNGHTITNLVTLRKTPEKMNGTLEKQWGNGFIGDIAQFTKVTIQNIKFDGATVTDPIGTGNDGLVSQHYAGVVVGHNQGDLTLENITVTNATIKNSWQAGGLVGYSDQDLTFKDCTIKDSYIGGIQATTGTLFGLGEVNITVNNSHAENVQLYTDGLTWASTQLEEGKYYVGHLYGRLLVDNQSTEKDLTIVVTENEANDLQKVLNNALDGMTVYLKNGTYNVDTLEIKHNIKLIGESKNNVKINISKELSGQAAMLVSNSAELKNLTVEYTGTLDIAVIKCTIIPADGMTPIQMIDKVVIDNVKVIGGKTGINIHAVKNAILNKIYTESSQKLGVSIAASNVTITNSNIPKGGWNASIGIMWKDDNPSYPVKSIVTIGEGNKIPAGYVDNGLEELDEKGNYYVLPDSTHTNVFSN